VASGLAVDTLAREVPALLRRGLPPPEALVLALRRANTVIHAEAAAPERAGMATTCTAVLLGGGDGAVVAHVGDSRAYLLRGAEVRQLTTDHSLVTELVRHGTLPAAEARPHVPPHVLTRALGTAQDVQVDVVAAPLRAGDILILTSDGLHTAVAADELAAVVRGTSNAAEACRTLIGLANARGGTDNASAVIVRLRPRWRDRVARALIPLALAAFLAAGAGTYRIEHAYFLGVSGDRVAVMRGVPVRVLGVPLFAVLRVTQVPVAQIAPAYRGRLAQGIPARDPEDAEAVLQDLLRRP